MQTRGKQAGDAVVVVCVFVTALLVAVVVGGAMVFEYLGCHAKWERAGMQLVEWGPIQGCMVKLPDGRWMPTERLREMDLPKETR